MPKDLPEMLQKTKWSKPTKEVETWDHWWAMHEKISKALKKTSKVINNWWSFTGDRLSNLFTFHPRDFLLKTVKN